MYLKALEIQGFKSFPDKTVLNFGEDVTAIVGPNGSGKSNISDAICWVMGEQSARSLRGAKMEDVIFGGTEKRSPVGFAQVTLVLDNSAHIFPAIDSSEVMVTRRYYRSGGERVLYQQAVRPSAGRQRTVYGHGPGPGGLRHHRAGPYRRDIVHQECRAPGDL